MDQSGSKSPSLDLNEISLLNIYDQEDEVLSDSETNLHTSKPEVDQTEASNPQINNSSMHLNINSTSSSSSLPAASSSLANSKVSEGGYLKKRVSQFNIKQEAELFQTDSEIERYYAHAGVSNKDELKLEAQNAKTTQMIEIKQAEAKSLVRDLQQGISKIQELKRSFSRSRTTASRQYTFADQNRQDLARKTFEFEKLESTFLGKQEQRNLLKSQAEELVQQVSLMQDQNEQMQSEISARIQETEVNKAKLREKVSSMDQIMMSTFKNVAEIIEACMSEQMELDRAKSFVLENSLEEF